MVAMTVHMVGTGELRAMDLDRAQADGVRCAHCNDTTPVQALIEIGKLVGPKTPVKACGACIDR